MEGIGNSEKQLESDKLVELKSAIRSGDFAQTKSMLVEINNILVGPSQFNIDTHEFEQFITGEIDSIIIYLGDGGMSRLVLDRENGEIVIDITGNATDKVKENWSQLLAN